MDDGQSESLVLALDAIRQQYGEDSITQWGAVERAEDYEASGITALVEILQKVLPSGIHGLDTALGIGGFPHGVVTEVSGYAGSGCKELALYLVAQVTRLGDVAAYIGPGFDMAAAEALGMEREGLLLIMQNSDTTLVKRLAAAETLVRAGVVGLVIVNFDGGDRAAAEALGMEHYGLTARLTSHSLGALTGALSRTRTVFVALNSPYPRIGATSVAPGGNALAYYSSVRIELTRVGFYTTGEASVIRFKVTKNKLGPPFRGCTARLMNGLFETLEMT